MQFFFTLFIFMNKAKTANKSPFTGTERPKEKILSAFNFLKARFNFLKCRFGNAEMAFAAAFPLS